MASVLTPGKIGDPRALLQAFRETLGATTCYVADLDAIQGSAVQRSLIRELAQFETGFPGALLVDAGTRHAGGTLEVLSCGASQVVIGLETLEALAELRAIVELVGPARVIFSLDLRLGRPMLHPALHDADGAFPDALSLASQAADAGVESLLILDVGRVGTGVGVDLRLLEAVRRRLPATRLLAGGGVLTRRDLDRMRETGCDAALVASAIHSGRVTADDLVALANRAGRDQSETRGSR